MRMSVDLSQSMNQSIRHSMGETSGDIPVYSLHRISRMLRKSPPPISQEMILMLSREIVTANATYREDSGNDWNCLTSNNLVSALEGLNSKTKEVTDKAIPGGKELEWAVARFKQVFDRQRGEVMATVKDWFHLHYEELLYNMDGKIPWAVVMKLRAGLTAWTVGVNNPFIQDIGDMILETAKESGVRIDNPDDLEAAWRAIGGTIFTTEG